MQTIKLTIEYDGTNFKGWQVQKKGERTVQGLIVDAFAKVFQEDIKLIGSGRTDTGVHAYGQVASFETALSKSPDEIRNALNANLPDDVVILTAKRVKNDFHAQYSAKRKSYRYLILQSPVRRPLMNNRVWICPYILDIEAMRKAADVLVGKHDFKTFTSNNRSNQDKCTVRTVLEIKISVRGKLIAIDVMADGFLYKMVRNIVGVLLEVGRGRLSKSNVQSMLRSKDREKGGVAAKACGLSLMKVWY